MAESKKGRGCLFYGCVTLIVLAIVAVIGTYFSVRWFTKRMTSSKPLSIPPVTLSSAEATNILVRVENFKTSLANGGKATPLTLTDEELDYMIRAGSGNGLNQFAHVTISGDNIHAQISMPLDMNGPQYFGKFFNGEMNITPEIQNGAVKFRASNVLVNGQAMPGFMHKMLDNLQWKPDANTSEAKALQDVDHLEVSDGKITIYPKTK